MKRSTFLFIITVCLVSHLQASEYGSGLVQMNFAQNLYPATPMKNVQTLTMQLWGLVDAAYRHDEQRETFMNNQEYFTKQVVTLHSMLDLLLLKLEEQTRECSECGVKALHDFAYIFDALAATAQRYKALTDSQQTTLSCVVNYLLEATLEKLNNVVQSGTISSNLYVFFMSSDVFANNSGLT